MRESAALYGGPCGGLLSRSHRIITFLLLLVTCLVFGLVALIEHWKRAFEEKLLLVFRKRREEVSVVAFVLGRNRECMFGFSSIATCGKEVSEMEKNRFFLQMF